jgi:RimJ/RimL family protein N-acetyltransferase
MAFQLETTRLLLKPMVLEDAAGLYQLNSDPDVVRYTGDVQMKSIEEATQFLKNYNVFERFGRGRLSTFIKETGEYIGWCGIAYLSNKNKFDIGYRLMKKFWGNGYATEAAEVCLVDGFTRLGLDKIIASAMNANTASINVFKKLGLTYSYDENCGCQPSVVYTITKAEWQDRQKN